MPFIIAIAFGLVLTWAARRIGLATGLVDRPAPGGPGGLPPGPVPPGELDPSAAQDPLKIHAVPIPVLGGMGVLLAVLATLLVVDHGLPVTLSAGVALAAVIGLLDDIRPLRASLRLLALAVAGATLAAGGLRVVPFGPLGAVAVPVLLLLLANAVNLIDGQDGLAGGLAGIACAGLAVVTAANGGNPLVAGALAGGLVGFLAWNLPPARVFLGNGGAYGLGAMLTVLACRVTAAHGWHGLLAAGLCLGVFAFELTFTVVRRLLAAEGLAVGDRRHTYDLLARSTGSRDRSTLMLWMLGAVSAATGYVADQVSLAAAIVMIACACVLGTGVGTRLWRLAMSVRDAA